MQKGYYSAGPLHLNHHSWSRHQMLLGRESLRRNSRNNRFREKNRNVASGKHSITQCIVRIFKSNPTCTRTVITRWILQVAWTRLGTEWSCNLAFTFNVSNVPGTVLMLPILIWLFYVRSLLIHREISSPVVPAGLGRVQSSVQKVELLYQKLSWLSRNKDVSWKTTFRHGVETNIRQSSSVCFLPEIG